MDPNRAYIVCETSAATQVEWYVERSFAVSLVKSRHPVIIRNTVSFVLSQKKKRHHSPDGRIGASVFPAYICSICHAESISPFADAKI